VGGLKVVTSPSKLATLVERVPDDQAFLRDTRHLALTNPIDSKEQIANLLQAIVSPTDKP
jgi:hypothetical protein